MSHVFNHAVHQRGQVTTLLGPRGVDVGTSDLPLMPRFAAAAPPAGGTS